MDNFPLAGILLYVLGGLAGAVFYLPFGRVRKWAWESYWMIYALVGLIVVPWVLAWMVSPNVLKVLQAADGRTLFWCYVFGAMWGLGGLTWGLMIRYLGVGLGLAIGCGLCASAGTLIPPVFQGKFAALLTAPSGIATLSGVAISLLGIVLVGGAGMSKESELPEEKKKAAVAEFDFKKGIAVAIFSGLMSSAMNFGLQSGETLQAAATRIQPVTSDTWKGVPVLVVVLLGGFTINCLWCLMLNVKNRTAGDYTNFSTPILGNLFFAGLAGAIWCSQMIFLKVADTKIGPLAFVGWSVLMSSAILFSAILGIFLGEWKGVSGRTKGLLAAGLAVLVTAVIIAGYGNKLKGEEDRQLNHAAPTAAQKA
jgi:L-rhamnose-H+ transport protein